MIAVSYLRCSSIGQLDGDSFERQAETIQRYADANGITIVACFFEAFTGTSDDRPAFNAMLEFCTASGATSILIERMDRWARKFSVGEYLTEKCRSLGLSVVNASNGTTLTEDDPSPSAWLAVAFEQLLAEYEKRTIVYRFGQAKTRLRKEGIKCEGKKSYNETNPDAVARAVQLRNSGMLLKDIAETLTQENFPTRTGKPWRISSVHQMIENAA